MSGMVFKGTKLKVFQSNWNSKNEFCKIHCDMLIHPFDFDQNYVFENEMIKIVPLEVRHIEKLQKAAQNEEVWTYFLENGLGTAVFTDYCLTAVDHRQQNKEYPFVIFDKRRNEYAGMTRLYDYHHRLGTIKMGHTWIGKDYWGTKLNKHCKFLLFDFIFNTLGLERIGFGVHGHNLRSVHSLKNIGCIQEGVLRNFLTDDRNGNRVDLLLFSMLQREWNSSIKASLKAKLS